MRTYLRHHYRLITLSLQRFAEPFFAKAIVVFPCIVEKVDPLIDRLRHNLIGCLIGLRGAEMITTKPHR